MGVETALLFLRHPGEWNAGHALVHPRQGRSRTPL